MAKKQKVIFLGGSSNPTRVVLPAVTQAAHGFVAGDVLKLSGTTWSKAIATSVANATAIAVVESVTTDTFIPVLGGRITLSGLTAGIYYLSDTTAGLLTLTAPTTVTSYLVTVLRAVSATEGYVEIESPLTLAAITPDDITGTMPVSKGGTGLTALGTPGQVPKVNAGGTALEYDDPTPGVGDVTAASSFGTDNRVLRSDGTGKGVQSSGAAINDSGEIQVLGDSVQGSLGLSDAHATTPKTIRLTVPATITDEYNVVFPGTIPTAGQVMRVASVTGTVVTLEHVTPLVNGGALGTPSSGTLTSCTMKDQLGVACSDETTAITAGTGKLTFRMPFAMTLTAVRASVTTAPTGAALVIDINENGTSILSTKLSIDASEKTSTTAATAAVISDTALADDAEMTIDFDQVGSTIAGAGVKVTLIGTRS